MQLALQWNVRFSERPVSGQLHETHTQTDECFNLLRAPWTQLATHVGPFAGARHRNQNYRMRYERSFCGVPLIYGVPLKSLSNV